MREALLHYILAHTSEDDWPASTSYAQNPSTKIDALLAIVRHHLRAPGLPPLHVGDQQTNALAPDPDYLPGLDGSPPVKSTITQNVAGGPDRIVVYLAFPKNNWIVRKVRPRIGSSLAFQGVD